MISEVQGEVELEDTGPYLTPTYWTTPAFHLDL